MFSFGSTKRAQRKVVLVHRVTRSISRCRCMTYKHGWATRLSMCLTVPTLEWLASPSRPSPSKWSMTSKMWVISLNNADPSSSFLRKLGQHDKKMLAWQSSWFMVISRFHERFWVQFCFANGPYFISVRKSILVSTCTVYICSEHRTPEIWLLVNR